MQPWGLFRGAVRCNDHWVSGGDVRTDGDNILNGLRHAEWHLRGERENVISGRLHGVNMEQITFELQGGTRLNIPTHRVFRILL